MRLGLAAVVSPLIVPLLLTLVFRFFYGEEADTNEAVRTSITYAQWLSYFITLIVGAGLYFAWRKKQWQSWIMYSLGGLVLGVISWIVFSLFSKAFLTLLFFVFLIAGLFTAVCFWGIVNIKLLPASQSSSRSRRRRRRAS